MTWLKVDDSILDHPKWVRAIRDGGSGVIHLWLAMATWSARHLTDGVIPSDMFDTVGGPQRRRKEALAALVRSGLCTVDGQGTVAIHDFTEHNPSREKVLSDRARVAENQRKHRLTYKVTSDADRIVTDSEIVSRPDPVPSVPIPSPKETLFECSSEPAAPVHDSLANVRLVFDEWRKVFEHPTAKLDNKRTLRIKARLKDFTPEQLCKALRGAAKDDWTMGRDPKSPRRYDGLETVLRDTAQVERFIELDTNGPVRRFGSRQPDAGKTGWEKLK